MSAETHRALAQRFCELLSARRMDELFSLVHDAGSWSIPYRADRFPFAGHKDKKTAAEMIGGFLAGFSEFSFQADNIAVDGNTVAIEARSRGVGPGNARYENIYHMHIEIRDGKLHTIREYFDPFQVLAYVEQLS